MIIRRATLDDFEALKEIKLLSKKEELKYSESIRPIEDNKEDYFRYLKKDLFYKSRGVFIAVDSSKVIALILAQWFKPLPISKFKKKGYISNLYILEEYRKKGIAKKLIKKAEEWLKDAGTQHISLEIHVDNKPALDLYKKLGYEDYTLKLSKKI